MTKREIINQYHFWLTGLVCDEQHQRYYQTLLDTLDDTEFTWFIPNDSNRAVDGINLRSRFADEHNMDYANIRNILAGPCSLLEMMVGLACRCEDGIMGNIEYGDRTPQWFWVMIDNLKLYQMDDERYNEDYVHDVIDSLLNRTYKRNGIGGLFYVPDCRRDLRKVEIWYQMCWYLNTIPE